MSKVQNNLSQDTPEDFPIGGPILPIIVIALLVLPVIINAFTHGTDQPVLDQKAAFRAALADSAVRDPANVSDNLVTIQPTNTDLIWKTPEHKELMMVSFLTQSKANQLYKNLLGSEPGGTAPDADTALVAVTAAPELQRFCQRLDGKDPSIRLRQYLGLRPESENDTIVELWVPSENLFRPCPDPDVTKSACTLPKKSDPKPVFKNKESEAAYNDILLGLYQQSYNTENGAPWTGLGYTYDWADGRREAGATEFILAPGSKFHVNSIQSAAKYCTR